MRKMLSNYYVVSLLWEFILSYRCVLFECDTSWWTQYLLITMAVIQQRCLFLSSVTHLCSLAELISDCSGAGAAIWLQIIWRYNLCGTFIRAARKAAASLLCTLAHACPYTRRKPYDGQSVTLRSVFTWQSNKLPLSCLLRVKSQLQGGDSVLLSQGNES